MFRPIRANYSDYLVEVLLVVLFDRFSSFELIARLPAIIDLDFECLVSLVILCCLFGELVWHNWWKS